MKIHQLLHQLVQTFAPMDERTSADLSGKASDEYGKIQLSHEQKKAHNDLANEFNKNLKENEDPTPLKGYTIGEKIVAFCENWWMQYLIGVAFIILVPIIRNYINGSPQEDNRGDDDDVQEFEAFKRFKRFNNGG